MNDYGMVVGYCNYKNPVVWRNGTATVLPINGYAYGVNNCNEVVGGSPSNPTGNYVFDGHAFVWRNGATKVLPAPQGYLGCANAINDYSVIAGTIFKITRNSDGTAAVTAMRPVIWANDQMQELPTLSNHYVTTTAINNRGEVVGWAYQLTAPYTYRALLWTEGQLRELGGLNGANACAYGINDFGKVVGMSFLGGPDNRITLWDKGNISQISYTGGQIYARDINNLGQITGHVVPNGGKTQSFIWSSDTGVCALGLASGYYNFAYAINNKGQLAGTRGAGSAADGTPLMRAITWNGTYKDLPNPS